jgi:hypothetical protein
MMESLSWHLQWPLLSLALQPAKKREEVMEAPVWSLLHKFIVQGPGLPWMQKLMMQRPSLWPLLQKFIMQGPGWHLLQKLMVHGPDRPLLQKSVSVLNATRDAFMTPPILSSVASLAVGQIPQLKVWMNFDKLIFLFRWRRSQELVAEKLISLATPASDQPACSIFMPILECSSSHTGSIFSSISPAHPPGSHFLA